MKGRKIKNLTKEDITIVDYKKILVKNSQFSSHAVWLQPPVLTRGPHRLLRPREGETVQQIYGQDEGSMAISPSPSSTPRIPGDDLIAKARIISPVSGEGQGVSAIEVIEEGRFFVSLQKSG